MHQHSHLSHCWPLTHMHCWQQHDTQIQAVTATCRASQAGGSITQFSPFRTNPTHKRAAMSQCQEPSAAQPNLLKCPSAHLLARSVMQCMPLTHARLKFAYKTHTCRDEVSSVAPCVQQPRSHTPPAGNVVSVQASMAPRLTATEPTRPCVSGPSQPLSCEGGLVQYQGQQFTA